MDPEVREVPLDLINHQQAAQQNNLAAQQQMQQALAAAGQHQLDVNQIPVTTGSALELPREDR